MNVGRFPQPASVFAMPDFSPESSDAPGAAAFMATRWSVVLQARRGSTGRREALEQLCSTYWLPIYGYLRRCGNSPADAEDLTQSFFVHLIESDFLDRPDPGRGRFRGYLIGALKHFLGAHFERLSARKRGGGIEFVDWTSIDAEREFNSVDQPQLDPSQAYETNFALALMARALRRLEEEQIAAGKARQFAALKPFLSVSPNRGDYETIARELAASRAAVAVWVHRLNQRYSEIVKLEVAATVEDPADAKEELHSLLHLLCQ
jgi:RNA polymerase sigma-70 factor (ECF subfamily)